MVTLELEERSRKNLEKNLSTIKLEYPKKAFNMIVKMLFDIKFLSQQKLKADGHIDTSRLRNSIYVQLKDQSKADLKKNSRKYSDEKGNMFDSELSSVKVGENEGVVGTNVEYANKIEFNYDSFLYWGSAHVDVTKRVSQLKKELDEIKMVR